MKIGSIYEVTIIDTDKLGHGVARIDDMVIFIKGALLDEKVLIKIIDIKKRYLIGELVEIIIPSKLRKSNICNAYNLCGGCDYLHILYELENKYKDEIIKSFFKDYKVSDIVYSNEYNYRNKVIFHVKNGVIGLYKKNTNELISVDECLLIDKNILDVYKKIKDINLSNISEVMIRISNLNEIMIVFDNNINDEDVNYLVSNNDLIKSIYINDKLIYGDYYIKNNINGIIYTASPKSFMQINYDMMIKLYDKIKYYAGYGDNLLDLYCGTGSIAIYLKDNYKNIDGIEIVSDAIKNANLNKKLNNINNINFICGDASIVKNNKYDTIIVDPPRGGIAQNVINKILNINAFLIIYVSCNYKTLKRDIDKIKDKYEVIEISSFNMFPKTDNIECIAFLKKI